MLNSVSEKNSARTNSASRAGAKASGVEKPPRVRLSRQERQRQLVGIGLRFLTERPIQEVSLDEVAREAGISRSLLFHYFPTKTAFYEAVVAAAGRRVARTVRPDEELRGEAAIAQFLDRYIAQIERRRELYVSLVHGSLAELGGLEAVGTLREVLAERVSAALREERSDVNDAVVHAWVAYVEDLTLRWSAPGGSRALASAQLRHHCLHALQALLAVPLTDPARDAR